MPALPDEMELKPSVDVSGIYNFSIRDNATVQDFAFSDDDLKLCFDVGVILTGVGGSNMSALGFYDADAKIFAGGHQN